MERARISYIVDIGLAVSFIIALMTGILKWRGWTEVFEGLLGTRLNILELTFLHDWSGILMGILVAVHLALHWKWIVCMTRNIVKRPGKRAKCD